MPDTSSIPAPLPVEDLPTVIAATMAAIQGSQTEGLLETASPQGIEASMAAQDASPEPAITHSTALSTQASSQTPEATSSELAPTAIAPAGTSSAMPTHTPQPELPIAGIQVFKPGDLSKVVSPIEVSAYLRPGAGGRVTIELFGEDGRLLVRQIRVYDVTPGARVNLAEKVPFQISAAAEVGRLVLSAADEAGRVIALNSVDLILLSMGDPDINPSDALLELIYIQQPKLKSLVQGGTVLISGLARPFTDQPLVVHLIADDGRVVGQRVVGVGERLDQGYGEFAVEVPYTVKQLTSVRLTVYEIGLPISAVRYLASLELVIGP